MAAYTEDLKRMDNKMEPCAISHSFLSPCMMDPLRQQNDYSTGPSGIIQNERNQCTNVSKCQHVWVIFTFLKSYKCRRCLLQKILANYFGTLFYLLPVFCYLEKLYIISSKRQLLLCICFSRKSSLKRTLISKQQC